MPKPKTKAIAVVGDTHAGSSVGLFPPSFRLSEGQVLTQSPAQRWMWDRWLDTCVWYSEYELSALIINGDIVQGINSRDTQLLTANEADMHNMALAVLEPLLACKPRRIYVTRGTGFHSGGGGWREELIAKAIRAEQDEKGNHSAFEWKLNWQGKLLYFTHHIQRAVVYPLTPLQRAQQTWRAWASNPAEVPDADIRSHQHTCHVYQDAMDGKITAIVPAWQGATEFLHKVAAASKPRVGGFLLCLDGERLQARTTLYPLPQPEVRIVPI